MSALAILDVETTSTDHATGSVVELAVARVHLPTGKLIDARSFLVSRYRGEHGAEEVHGVPASLVDEFGLDMTAAVEGLRRYVASSLAICAHFCDFDSGWFPALGVPWVDSNDFETPRVSGGRSLTAIALAHGVGVVAAHRALDDVLTLARVLERCRELGADLEHMVKRAMRPKVTVKACVPFERNDELKAAGFRWHPKPVAEWRKKMFVDDVAKLGFPTKEVAA